MNDKFSTSDGGLPIHTEPMTAKDIKKGFWRPLLGLPCPACTSIIGIAHDSVSGMAECQACGHTWEVRGAAKKSPVLRPDQRPAILAKIMTPAPSAVVAVAKLRGTNDVTFEEDWQRLLNEVKEAEAEHAKENLEGFAFELCDIILTVYHIAAGYNFDMQTLLHVKHMENLKRATPQPEEKISVINYCDQCDNQLSPGDGNRNHTGQLLCDSCYQAQTSVSNEGK